MPADPSSDTVAGSDVIPSAGHLTSEGGARWLRFGRPRFARVLALSRRLDPGFCIFRRAPAIRLASMWSGRRTRTFGVVLGVLLIPRIVLTSLAGTLLPADGGSADLGVVFFGRLIEAHAVPWIHDYADIIIVFLIAAHTAHIVSQWRRLSSLPGRLRTAGMLGPRPEECSSILGIFDRRFSWVRLEIAAIAIAIAVTAVIMSLPKAAGLYWELGSGQPALERFANWWANPDSHGEAFAVLWATYFGYIYLNLRTAIMGVIYFWMFHTVKKASDKKGVPWLGYSDPWRLGKPEEAVEGLLGVLNDATISISLLASVFLIGSLYVFFPTLVWLLVASAFVALTPHFLLIPSVELNRRIGASWWRLYRAAVAKQERSVKLVQQMASGKHLAADRASAELSLQASTAMLGRLDRLPREVMNWKGRAGGLVIYLVPVLGVLVTFLGSRQ